MTASDLVIETQALTKRFGAASPSTIWQLREQDMTTRLLYLRGERDRSAPLDADLSGLRGAGVRRLEHGTGEDAGHFTPEENPAATWRQIARFLRADGGA